VHEAWLPREHSLHRPRHGRRQLTALISALLFFGTPTLMWVFGMRPAELENHELASFPSPLDGWGFLTGMDDWATDNLVFREEAIVSADWVSRSIFGEPAPFDQGNSGPPAGPLAGSPDSRGSTENETPGAEDESAGYRRVIEGSDGWMYLGLDVTNKCQPKQPIDQSVAQLAALRAAVESSGRKFMLVVVPDKSTMVPDHLPDTYPGKKCAREASPELWRQLALETRAIDMRVPLQAATDVVNRPLYFPLDSHWTDEGALTMVRQIADRLEPGVSGKWKIREAGSRTAEADLPKLIGRHGENHATNYRLLPDGKTDRTGKHLDDPRTPVRRTSKPLKGMVDQPTLLLGDSFMLPSSAYMSAAFADITQVYYNTIESNPATVVSAMADNDVVVLEMVERNIALGTPAMLSPAFIDQVRQELQKHPIR
jgi:alginate O-acetyltransferase complex protein AlgJ